MPPVSSRNAEKVLRNVYWESSFQDVICLFYNVNPKPYQGKEDICAVLLQGWTDVKRNSY
jgi:hypothetical protein